MAYSSAGRPDRPVTRLTDLSPRIGAYLAQAHTMPGRHEAVDVSGVPVQRIAERRAPGPRIHAKGDTTGHTHVGLYAGIRQHKHNASPRP